MSPSVTAMLLLHVAGAPEAPVLNVSSDRPQTKGLRPVRSMLPPEIAGTGDGDIRSHVMQAANFRIAVGCERSQNSRPDRTCRLLLPLPNERLGSPMPMTDDSDQLGSPATPLSGLL